MKDTIKKAYSLDDVYGILTEPLGDGIPYDVRKIDQYCKKNNIRAEDLTENQLRLFEIR